MWRNFNKAGSILEWGLIILIKWGEKQKEIGNIWRPIRNNPNRHLNIAQNKLLSPSCYSFWITPPSKSNIVNSSQYIGNNSPGKESENKRNNWGVASKCCRFKPNREETSFDSSDTAHRSDRIRSNNIKQQRSITNFPRSEFWPRISTAKYCKESKFYWSTRNIRRNYSSSFEDECSPATQFCQ